MNHPQMPFAQPDLQAYAVEAFAQPDLQANRVLWQPGGMCQVAEMPSSSPWCLQVWNIWCLQVTLKPGPCRPCPACLVGQVWNIWSGQVWALASDPQGTWAVQQALEEADCDDTRVALALELRSHVWDALKCPNANHVLQKCIETMNLQFIIDELLESGPKAVVTAARDRYGCRVLQRLIEHCSPDQVERIARDLLADPVPLCKHEFGNFVLKHLLEHGTKSHISNLMKALSGHSSTVGRNLHGPGVLSKAFDYASREDQMTLASAILADLDLLASMGCSRHGHLAVMQALECAERYNMPQSSIALAALMGVGVMEKLKAKGERYGKVLAKFVQESKTDVN